MAIEPFVPEHITRMEHELHNIIAEVSRQQRELVAAVRQEDERRVRAIRVKLEELNLSVCSGCNKVKPMADLTLLWYEFHDAEPGIHACICKRCSGSRRLPWARLGNAFRLHLTRKGDSGVLEWQQVDATTALIIRRGSESSTKAAEVWNATKLPYPDHYLSDAAIWNIKPSEAAKYGLKPIIAAYKLVDLQTRPRVGIRIGDPAP